MERAREARICLEGGREREREEASLSSWDSYAVTVKVLR